MSCVYLGEAKDEFRNKEMLFACQINGECVQKNGNRRLAQCSKCRSRLELDHPDFASKWVDPVVVYDRQREPTTALRNMLAGGSAFLVCGGPSANPLLERLNSRGCFSLAVNNAAAHKVRPQAFICSDPPMKFHQDIWMDPGVMKFVPRPKMQGYRARMRSKIGGVFDKMPMDITAAPNIWGFKRWSWLYPDDRFFLSDGCCWGNQDDGRQKTGEEKTVCMRLLRYLGAKRIYLVGVDFYMTPELNYSFSQARDAGVSASNNEHFATVSSWLCRMVKAGTFERFGLEVFNCCERSGLRAFPYMPFDEALPAAKGIIHNREQAETGEPDCEGWYEKSECPKCGSWHVRYTADLSTCLAKNCGFQWNTKKPPKLKPEKNK